MHYFQFCFYDFVILFATYIHDFFELVLQCTHLHDQISLESVCVIESDMYGAIKSGV